MSDMPMDRRITPGKWASHDIAPDDTDWQSRFEVWAGEINEEAEDEEGIPCAGLIASHVKGQHNAALFALAGTIANELYDLGYDPFVVMEKLPDLLLIMQNVRGIWQMECDGPSGRMEDRAVFYSLAEFLNSLTKGGE